MDKSVKRSLIFGALVGGTFALLRNAGEKQKLTESQLKSVNELKDAFVILQSTIVNNLSLAPIYTKAKELEPQKKYNDLISFLESEIQKGAEHTGQVKLFKSKLQHILSGRFSEQRNNERTHSTQSFFLQFKELPDILLRVLEKKTQILRLMQRGFRYVDLGEEDFRNDDKVTLQELVSEYNAAQKEAEQLLSGLHSI